MKTKKQSIQDFTELTTWLSDYQGDAGFIVLLEVSTRLEKIERGEIMEAIYTCIRPTPTLFDKVRIDQILFIIVQYIKNEHPEIEEGITNKWRSQEAVISQINDLIELVNSNQLQMTGQEPELKYWEKEVLDKLLADNKVPQYYHEEFYQQIEEFNGLSLET